MVDVSAPEKIGPATIDIFEVIYVVDVSAPEKIGPATIDLIELLNQPALQVL